MSALINSFIAVCVLALVQLATGRVTPSRLLMNRAWLSFAGGVAVGYVFLHLLPELAADQIILAEEIGPPAIAGYAIHFTALLGLTVYLAVERACSLVHRAGHHGAIETVLHYGSFAFFNAVIGYVSIQRAELGMGVLMLFAGAVGLHLLLSTHGLRDAHEEKLRVGRWALSLSLLFGWGVGSLLPLPAMAQSFLFAFLSGGIILNVLKEEIPAESESRLWAFMTGLAIFGLLILLIVSLFPGALEHVRRPIVG
jgi:hypothetical protein